jgi:hypothetical protein
LATLVLIVVGYLVATEAAKLRFFSAALAREAERRTVSR